MLNIPHPSYKNPRIRLEVPCGKCVECLESRRSMWSIRLAEEAKDHIHTSFITLTYSDENIVYGEYFPTLVKDDVQRWLKRLRKRIEPEKIRYYLVGEYGTKTMRPHYHVLLFGLNNELIKDGIIEKTWSKGNIQVGQLNRKTIHYATKYHVNRSYHPVGSESSFSLMSKRPAIGHSYLKKMEHIHDGNIDRAYYQDGDFKKPLPRYYREKLYCQYEREQMNINVKSMYDIKELESEETHYENNNINYYKLKNQEKEEKIRKYLSKVNESNKF